MISEESFQIETSKSYSLSSNEGISVHSQTDVVIGSIGASKIFATDEIYVKSGKKVIMQCGAGSIVIDFDGTITIKGTVINFINGGQLL